MKIARELYDQMIAHALAEAPNECCGLVSSRDGRAVKVYPAENALASPLRYEIEPDQLLGITTEIDDADLDIGIIFHSHPRTVPEPSQTDINLALWPGSIYVIIGLSDPERPDVRAWNIEDGEVSKAELVVE
jgi:proteasome lid subunit RPN8/RPN11